MAAATSVGISRKNWQDSLNLHFSYPNKDQPLLKVHKEAAEEYWKPIVDESATNFTVDNLGPAWRWLILRDADNEDKMVQIHHKGDRKLYHQVKAYELAKTED